MSDLIKSEEGGIVSLLHKSGGGIELSNPYERNIFLFDSYVAGTSYVENIKELEPNLKEGDRLEFYREPENKFDPMAIVVTNAAGEKIGYVPRRDNIVFSRLMDAGKLLFGKIVEKKTKGDWLSVSIKIYLHE